MGHTFIIDGPQEDLGLVFVPEASWDMMASSGREAGPVDTEGGTAGTAVGVEEAEAGVEGSEAAIGDQSASQSA